MAAAGIHEATPFAIWQAGAEFGRNGGKANDEPVTVSAGEPSVRRDFACFMPMDLRDASGRKFDIVEWHPHVVAGHVVTADIKVVVRVPKP